MVSSFPPVVVDDPPDDLPDLLARLVRRDGSATAAIDIDPARRSVPVSRAELWRRTLGLADQLRSVGITIGDCIAVWLPNWSDALCWQFAASLCGAHVIGVNTRYNTDDATHLLQRSRPKLVAVAHRFHGLDLRARLVQAVRHGGLPTPSVAVVAGPGADPVDDLSAYDLGAGAWVPDPVADAGAWVPEPVAGTGARDDGTDRAGYPAHPGALAVAFTTSGSTGLPKLAAHRGTGVLAHALADVPSVGLAEGDVMLCGVPLAGTFGFSAAMAALAAGAAVLLEPVFDADGVLEDMARHRVTHVVGGDDLVLRLADAWRARPRELSSWRWWGAANFQGRLRELAEWAASTFGTEVTGLYGSSEVFALTAMWPADEPVPRRWEGGGRVVAPTIQVRVADPDTGRSLPIGQEGELQFRGPNVVDAYLGDPGAAARSFTGDGWFRSGDLGCLVEDGVFVYTCRMGDALRLRGFLVDPAEIEIRLAEHADVHTAKVVGIDGPEGGTVAVGFVVPAEGTRPTSAQLRDWCAATLAKFKVPEVVHVIDEMPTTSGTNGTKIRAAALREWARQWA